MSQDQPSWIVAEPTPPPAASREIVLGRPDEATIQRRERAMEEEATGSNIPYRVIGLSLVLGAAAAAVGTFIATMNPVIEEPIQSAAAMVVDETRTLQGGVPIRSGMNNGVVTEEPAKAPPAPSGEPD